MKTTLALPLSVSVRREGKGYASFLPLGRCMNRKLSFDSKER
jgi:hypothetical protein